MKPYFSFQLPNVGPLEVDSEFEHSAEEEFQLSLKKALVQKNPWLPSSENDDPLASEEHTAHTVGGCTYREFANYTVYSKPAFVHEYLKYVTCMQNKRVRCEI